MWRRPIATRKQRSQRRCSRRSNSSWYSTIEINKGSSDGVEVNQSQACRVFMRDVTIQHGGVGHWEQRWGVQQDNVVAGGQFAQQPFHGS